jgi:hypothetical protein
MKTYAKVPIGVHGKELPKFTECKEKEWYRFTDDYVISPKIGS